MARVEGYQGNPNLPRDSYIHAFTQHEIDEYKKCANDPIYFATTYMRIVNVDKGLMPFDMWDFQKNMLMTFHKERFSICKLPRQVGKCFDINTIVTIKHDDKIFDITIGDLYESIRKESRPNFEVQDKITEKEISRENTWKRLCGMSHLRVPSRRPNLPCWKISQNKTKRIWERTHFALRRIFESAVRTNKRKEKSGISTWRNIFSLVQKIYKGRPRSRNIKKEGQREQTINESGHHKISLLVEKDQRRFGRSPETTFRKTINLLLRKVYRKIWGRSWLPKMVDQTRKLVKITQKTKLFQNITKIVSFHYGKLQIGNGIFCGMEPTGYGRLQKQRIQVETVKWKNNSSRFHRCGKKENNRIRWGILAWPDNVQSGKGKGTTEHDREWWVYSTENKGKRIQIQPGTNSTKLSDFSERKFIESISLENIQILADTGWVPATWLHKTIKYDKWILKTENHELICADDHIVFMENHDEVYVKNLIPGDRIITKSGIETIVSCIDTLEQDYMYDITVDSEDHRLYTNGILSHNTTTAVAFLLHFILFNENVNVAILANKSSTAREIMSRVQLAFEYLPRFLQQGVKEWNKGSIELANGSRAIADSTSGSSIRGRTFNVIFLDEFAHIPNNVAEAFFMSTYPTISSGNTTKVIIVSTPNGLNLFYKLWKDAEEKRSLYVPISIHWSQVPGRDEKWKEETIRNTSQSQFDQEFECNFIGSTNTLISPTKLSSLVFKTPIRSEGKLDIYEDPIPEHTYVMTVDVSEGQNLDYSTYSIIDVTDLPYKQVAKFKDNTIQPLLLPTLLYTTARKFNDAFVLVEINTIGLQVSDILHHELAYENLIKIELKGRQGQQFTPGFKKRIAYGLKQSVQTKKIGCANLKTLIESDKLILNDADTILELTTFSAHKQSFAAEEGNNDDLAMTLVNFGWLTGQRYFKDNIKNDIRKALQEEQLQIMDNDISPFIIDDGLDIGLDLEREKDLWVVNKSRYVFDNTDWDILSNRFKL